MEKLKPFIKDLVKIYYGFPNNGAGGMLHIVLDDGNVEHTNIYWCYDRCEEVNDTLGMVICEILLQFTEDELEEMYDSDWWGMG